MACEPMKQDTHNQAKASGNIIQVDRHEESQEVLLGRRAEEVKGSGRTVLEVA